MIIGGKARLLLDYDFTVIEGDDGFYALSGYSRDEFKEILGNKCRNNMQGLDHINLIHLLKGNSEISEFDFRIYTKDKNIRWIQASIEIVDYTDGVPVVEGIFYDVTKLKTEQYERSIIYDNIPGAVVKYRMDDKLTILDANSNFYELLGTTKKDYEEGSLARFTYAQKRLVHKIISTKLPNHEDIVLEYKTSHKQTGQDVWIHWEGKYIGMDGNYPIYLAVLIDISYQKHLEQELEQIRNYQNYSEDLKEIANKDPLTGLDNRSSFRSKVETFRHSKDCFGNYALMMLDLDGFKQVNDTCGHLFGDDVLCMVCDILSKLTSDNIIIGRFGGDEFLIFIKHTNKDEVNRIASYINKEISSLNLGKTNNISCSIGIILTEDIVSDYNKLVQTADEALYAVKEAGKNGYLVKEAISI